MLRIEGQSTSDYVNVDLGVGASSTTGGTGSLNITGAIKHQQELH